MRRFNDAEARLHQQPYDEFATSESDEGFGWEPIYLFHL